jgi:hypothetical protein
MECGLYISRVMHRKLCSEYLRKMSVSFCCVLLLCLNWLCMLLLQGEALFQTHENLEHLAMMERVLGPFPQQMLKRVE